MAYWKERTGIAITQLLIWLQLSTGKYYAWKKRRKLGPTAGGMPRGSDRVIPKAHWLLPWEVEAIVEYRLQHPTEGYRRLAYMMLDADVVAVSPSSVYRVLKKRGLLLSRWRHTRAKGSGFIQPTRPHEHWHLDISYINYKGTFVYLMALIDGYSRLVVHFAVKLSIEALDVEIFIEEAREKFPSENPILITDNGPQFIAKEFKTYLQIVGITHRRTRFFYPQSNGKVERFIQTCKNESVRKQSFIDLEDLIEQIAAYIEYYNTQRLHSALGYITPLDMLEGRQQEIIQVRKQKLLKAQEMRKNRHRESAYSVASSGVGDKHT
ncbi:MAG: IS3 family transposase [candidate division KSB1 bacterium]|nr:IS3 family transposase [candidate division KSB1 bacterium]